jgi:hypothetical protein
MDVVLNKVLTGIVVRQMSDVIFIHYLQIHLFTEQAMKESFFAGCTSYTLLSLSSPW